MRILLALLLVAALASPVMAAGEGSGFPGPGAGAAAAAGGFAGPITGGQADTVQSAKRSWDDTSVVLVGNIVSRQAGHDDLYTFKDKTGSVLVEIDDDLFYALGQKVTPQTLVRISGEVDKEFMEGTQIDVEFMEIVR